jgi:hypothetical protein
VIDVSWPVRLLRIGIALLVVALIFALGAVFELGPFRAGTKAQATGFSAQAELICRATGREFERLQEQDPLTPADAAALAEALARVAKSEQDALSSLAGIAPDPDAMNAYLEARARAIGLIEDGAAAAADGDMDAYGQAQARLARGQAQRRSMAAAAELSGCSA